MDRRANSTVTLYNLFSLLPQEAHSLPTNLYTCEWAHAVLEYAYCAKYCTHCRKHEKRSLQQKVHLGNQKATSSDVWHINETAAIG